MDFSIPDELQELVATVRKFRERELMPLEQQYLSAGKWEHDVWEELEAKGRKQGLWALEVPEELGGQGLGVLGSCLVAEELFKHPAMFKFGGTPEPVLYLGNDHIKQKYLYPTIAGERRACYAFTEPGTGSDLAGIRTTAVRRGDDWVINGAKIFISEADRADYCIVFASTDLSLGARGVTCFVVDMDAPGFALSRPIPTMGDGWEPYELAFADCVVSDSQRLGEIGEGWKLANEQLTHGRLHIAAYQLGIAQRSIDIAVAWAQQRETWGKKLATRQAIQWPLADSVVELDAARMLVYRAAWLADQGLDFQNEAFMAKLYATEMAQRVTDRCLQILGGMGYSKELPIQSFFRQVRVWRIGHGTSEIHRWMIARKLLGASAKES